MKRLLEQLEKKWGRYAIPNLTRILIACYAIGYVIALFFPYLFDYLTLEPARIFQGEIWRIISWIFIPPSLVTPGFGIFLTLIMLLFYLSIGTSLERVWGSFRYNVYVFGGMLLTVIAAFLCYFLFGRSQHIGQFISTYYITTSLFLAFAATFPNAEVRLYFVLPLKVKWLGIIYALFILYDIVGYGRQIAAGSLLYWVPVIVIIASFLNFILFFFTTRDMTRFKPSEIKRKREFQKGMQAEQERMKRNAAAVGATQWTRHRCTVCGRTEKSDPELEFRFCSKCDGAYEYCSEHLYTHTHILAKKETL